MNDNVEILRRYNRWRRGHALWNATADLPDPRVVGEAIDAACDEIERLRVQVSALEAEREDLRCVIADISVKCASLCAERDRLRAELAECRAALELIAAPQRSDGSWNRDREACRQVAQAALAAKGIR